MAQQQNDDPQSVALEVLCAFTAALALTSAILIPILGAISP